MTARWHACVVLPWLRVTILHFVSIIYSNTARARDTFLFVCCSPTIFRRSTFAVLRKWELLLSIKITATRPQDPPGVTRNCVLQSADSRAMAPSPDQHTATQLHSTHYLLHNHVWRLISNTSTTNIGVTIHHTWGQTRQMYYFYTEKGAKISGKR